MKYLLTLFLSLLSYLLVAQNVIVEHYSKNQGLLNNMVSMTEKDSDGFMWFATWYGLCRFDGEKVLTYNHYQLDHDVPPRKIQYIIDDAKGFIWIKTIDHKLYLFDKKKECFKAVYGNIKRFVANVQVIKLQRAFDDYVLLLTKDKNLFLARVDEQGKVQIELLFEAKDYIDSSNYMLKSNLFFENNAYIGWIGVDYKINVLPKGEALKGKPADFFLNQVKLNSGSNFSSSVIQDKLMWLGTSDGYFYCIDSEKGNVTRHYIPQNMGAVTDILTTSAKALYVSVANKGVFEYSPDKRKSKKINVDVNERLVSHSFIDSYNKLWFHENERAVVYYDPVTNKSRRYPFSVSGKITSFIVEDAGEQGVLFLSPAGEALFFDRDNLTMCSINQIKSIMDVSPNQLFFHFFIDDEGTVWLSSTEKGVYHVYFPKKQFRTLVLPVTNKAAGKDDAGVRACFQSRNGDIWVGNRMKDVFRFDSKGYLVQTYPAYEELFGAVYHVMEDDKGNLWFATKGDGLVKLTPDVKAKYGYRFQRFKHNPSDNTSLSGDKIYYTYQDSHKRIWVCTLDGGLNLLHEQGGSITFFNDRNGFINYSAYGLPMEVRNIVEDKEGRMWVGTMDGLISFDGNFSNVSDIKFEAYRGRMRRAYADSDVCQLYKDSKDTVWASVFGGGLNKLVGYDEEKHEPEFVAYELVGNLKNEVITSIIEDRHGMLWLGTKLGVVCFDRQTGNFRTYTHYDGFPDFELEEGGVCTPTGEIWMGGTKGIIIFHPDELKEVDRTSKTFIVNCQIGNQDIRLVDNPSIVDRSISYVDEIKLNHDQSMFSFEFVTLSYVDRNSISYRYILEGYEEQWHFNGVNRLASYTNVPSGNYVFRVQAMDDNGVDSFSECKMRVIIRPPWWATWWAYVIYVLLGAGVLYMGIRLSVFLIRMRNNVYIDQRLSELKIRFFTNVSHELRTPLTLIQGPIQELKTEALSVKGKKYVELMEKNTLHMLKLVNQILDFRKIQNGKMRLHVSCFNLTELLAFFEKEFMIMAEEKAINLQFCPEVEELMVWGDKERLGTVVRNLLSNAFKFTSSGGSIRIVSGLAEDGKHCFIRVEDTGVGIPQNKLTEIFGRFSQADNAKGAYYQGTGIGLALSKEIVELHHGEIFAANGKQGAQFTVWLLLGKEQYKENEVDFYLDEQVVKEVPDCNERVADEKNGDASLLPSVLVVDDNVDLCNMLKLQLEDRFNIHLAHDGVEGLKMVNFHHPDVVVTDQMMPCMDGMEMLKRIRGDFQISHIPVIMLTAKGDEDSKIQAISQGANAYIVKPFSKDYLVVRIEQLLGERKRFREQMCGDNGEMNDKVELSDNYAGYLEKKDLDFIEKIHQVVEDNMENSDFNIDTIAASVGLSRSAFFKKLKSLTGLAPVDWVKEIRLNKSVELIKKTDLSISEIAFAVGFNDSGYFSKCFRKKYNQTPREYINAYRGKK